MKRRKKQLFAAILNKQAQKIVITSRAVFLIKNITIKHFYMTRIQSQHSTLLGNILINMKSQIVLESRKDVG